MEDDTEEGIILNDSLFQGATLTIDWEAMLRDFAWAHALTEKEEQKRELVLHSARPFQTAR